MHNDIDTEYIKSLVESLDPSTIVYKEYRFLSYALIEGSKHPMLWSELEEGVLSYDMLFKEKKLREALQSVGPYLVELDFSSEDRREQSIEILKRCYGKNSTIFFATPLDFSQSLQRVRDIFYLRNEQGRDQGIIRFYEPVIFEELVKDNNDSVVKNLFYHIYCYWCEESKDSSAIIQYRYTSTTIEQTPITLIKER